MLIKKMLTLISGKISLVNSRDILHVFKRIYTNELIDIEDNEVLILHSPVLLGTSRVYIKGTGRLKA